jgi:hypothetical protein
MRHPDDECFQCGVPIVPRAGVVSMCEACVIAHLEDVRLRAAWKKRLSAMGAYPGRKTKRAARLEAVRKTGVVANDNGRKFGEERRSR